MPYTRKQVKLFLSSASPLSSEQQQRVKSELHANPSMGHAKKGSAELKKPEISSNAYNFRSQRGRRAPMKMSSLKKT